MNHVLLSQIIYGAFGASLAVSISGALMGGAILLIYGSYRRVKLPSQPAIFITRLDILVFIYFLLGVGVTTFYNPANFAKSITSQSALLVYILMAHLASSTDIKPMLKWFVYASVFLGILGLLQFYLPFRYLPNERVFLQPEWTMEWPRWLIDLLSDRNGRAVGTRSHPLTYAEGLMVSMFLVAALFIRSLNQQLKINRENILLVLAGLFIGAGILVSESRGVWGGLIFGFLMMVPFLPKSIRFRSIGLALLLAVGIFTFSSHFRGRLLSIFTREHGGWADQQSKNIRLELWQDAVSQIKKNPIVGKGIRGNRFHANDPMTSKIRTWSEAHNIYLQELVERGFIGFFIFLMIIFMTVKMLLGLPPPWKWGILACLIGFCMSGMTESWTHDKEIELLFWGVIGLSSHIYRRSVKQG